MWVCPKCKAVNNDSLNRCCLCNTWICPKCKAVNNDSLNRCYWCHTEPDGTEHPLPKPAGMPRRFGIGTLMILIALFGLLFAILKMHNVPPVGYFIIGIFFITIAAAQAILFKGKQPRTASIITGGVFGFLLAAKSSPEVFIPYVFIGCVCGYSAGALIAGIFLVRERESDEADDSSDTEDVNQ